MGVLKIMSENEDRLAESLSEILSVAPESAEEIWAEFFPRMMRLAKKKLADLPRRDFDEEDVAQSALNSFFRGKNEGRFDRLDSKDEMWRLLATITARKATRQKRRYLADKRGGGGVRGESIFVRAGQNDDSINPGLAAMRDENLMPETTEEILNTCQHLLDLLPDEKHRQTAIFRLEGYANQEIARELGCSVARTKQRLQRIREIWKNHGFSDGQS